MRRITFALASAALAVGTLAACGGGDDTEAYCDAIESASATLKDVQADAGDVDTSDPEAAMDAAKETMTKTVESFEKIRDAAPSDIKGDWDTMVDMMNQLADADSAEDAADLDQEKAEEAGDNIEKNVKDECDFDMSDLGV